MNIKIGKYRHSKSGREYEVVGVAHQSETLEELVVYKALYHSAEFGENALWVRPASMFLEKVLIEGKEVDRFEYTGE
jgi:hypothetical protein